MDFNIDFSKLAGLFVFNPDNPLQFGTLTFMFLLALGLLIYHAVYPKQRLRASFLLIFSIFIYYKIGGLSLLLLLGVGLVNYLFGYILFKIEDINKRRYVLWGMVLVNLFLLGYFKYTNFIFAQIATLQDADFTALDIILPVGISYYIFKVLSYLFDIYYEKFEELPRIDDFMLYVTFFGNIQLGPIDRADEFIPQIKENLLTSEEGKRITGLAVFFIASGIIKKMIIADYIYLNFISRVFEDPLRFTGAENILAIYSNSIHIYFDFSGYSDMAVGLALLFGYKIIDNFNSPYKATSVAEFWRRWHISLSRWLLDYLFTPSQMGLRRVGKIGVVILLKVLTLIAIVIFEYIFRLTLVSGVDQSNVSFIFFVIVRYSLIAFYFIVLVNIVSLVYHRFRPIASVFPLDFSQVGTSIALLITFMLCGLWHGATWGFILWGTVHGLIMGVSVLTKKIRAKGMAKIGLKESRGLNFFRGFIAFHIITITWILFRVDTLEKIPMIWTQISENLHATVFTQFYSGFPGVVILSVVGIFMIFFPEGLKERFKNFLTTLPLWAQGLLLGLVIYLASQIMMAEMVPPIYFEF